MKTKTEREGGKSRHFYDTHEKKELLDMISTNRITIRERYRTGKISGARK